MLRADRLCIYVFMFGFILVIPSAYYIKYIDELCSAGFAMIAFLDCIANNNWKRYKLLWILMGIMGFYALYSIPLHFNTIPFIAMDFVIELKPFIPVAVLIAIAPVLTPTDRLIIKKVAVVNASAMSLCLMLGEKFTQLIVFHITNAGLIIFISSMAYLICSVNSLGQVSKKDILTTLTFLTLGLLCTRSKYYGIYVLSLFFMLFYRPGTFRSFNFKHLTVILAILGLVISVGWSKFSFYFLTGNSDTFDPNVVQSFARPVLYATGGMIMYDYFPFGSGLASFASYGSMANYSNLYYEYGIDKVYGLSPQKPDFICDAFYPSLAQFGVVGIILFIYFWVYLYSYLREMIRTNGPLYKYPIASGCSIICFLLIECIGGNTLTQATGMIAMCMLGFICAASKSRCVHDTNSQKYYLTNTRKDIPIKIS